jgi:hypothetical protein
MSFSKTAEQLSFKEPSFTPSDCALHVFTLLPSRDMKVLTAKPGNE